VKPEQALDEIRKELAVNERLASLLVEHAAHYASTALRKSYSTNEPALLIRQAGLAEGAEQFIAHITKPPAGAHSDR